MKHRSYTFFLISACVLLIGCSKADRNTNTTQSVAPSQLSDIESASSDALADTLETLSERELAYRENLKKNLETILQSIINGDSHQLASVTNFPIHRQYPEKDITNEKELKKMFPILFDDSIRQALKEYTYLDWLPMGWRGHMLNHGYYLWADEYGQLNFITYDSSNLPSYRQQLMKEEYQPLDESSRWVTVDCLVSQDSSLFLRLEEDDDDVQRLHLFTRDSLDHKRHFVFNGTMENQGTCYNQIYSYACIDGIIKVWISSPTCLEGEIIHGVKFPDEFSMGYPNSLCGKTFACEKAYWRDVKKWW